jgi:hypothetical protein
MGFNITIPVTNNSEPQFMEGLGGFTPGEPFVISDAQAEEFKALHETSVEDWEGWKVKKVKDPEPPAPEAATEAATEEEGDK